MPVVYICITPSIHSMTADKGFGEMFLQQHPLYAHNHIQEIIYQFTLHPLGYGTQISTED